jgi:hypothetical protein
LGREANEFVAFCKPPAPGLFVLAYIGEKRRRDGPAGDLCATAQIRTPVSVTAEERVLWEKLARISKFKPRN